jgi:glycosyltransferase involved in cell wall biosynthesis
VVEQVERLARDYEVHVYSNRVEDIDPATIVWHRVPALPGPHLLAFCWWFVANHVWRWWDRVFQGLRFDLTYTPGINCLDADVITVHIVFSEFYFQLKDALSFRQNPVSSWPRLVHRRLYYLLIIALEHVVYSRKRSLLIAISRKTAEDLKLYGRLQTPVTSYGVDPRRFTPESRQRLRAKARDCLKIPQSTLCLLLVGNDWKKKGLIALLEAVCALRSDNLRLLIVGHDDPAPYRTLIARNGISQHVIFLPLRSDVEFYYSASDVYVSPALEEAFGLPPLEAMACGLPVIVSSRAGVSEIISDGVDGLVLKNPKDVASLAKMISELQGSPSLCQTLGDNAARTARQYAWDHNASQLRAVFEHVIERRSNYKKAAIQEVP